MIVEDGIVEDGILRNFRVTDSQDTIMQNSGQLKTFGESP